MREFPSFWADAQDRVKRLELIVAEAERGSAFGKPSAPAFRQSLAVCEAKRKAIYSGGEGSGGGLTEMRCRAVLLCSRLVALDVRY